jgi:multidrug efflux pump subunit AcrA (membrane-fusion protein)
MLLKLLLPQYNHMVTGGSIAQWHKAEGEWVTFGDVLFDLKVERIQITRLLPFDVPRQIEMLVNAQAAARHLSDEEVGIAAPVLQSDCQLAVFRMRIASSDHGILRKIYAKEGEHREVGDVLAVLSTEEDEPIEGVDESVAKVSVFRAVASMS